MTRLVTGTTMSLDGFMADVSGSAAALYTDWDAATENAVMKEIYETTGAVLMGRRTFEMAEDPDGYADGYEFRTPLVILTSHPPARKPKEGGGVSFHFETSGLDAAIKAARRLAAGKDVHVIGGWRLIHSLVREGKFDEMHIDVMPVLLGQGLPLFENTGEAKWELERHTALASGRLRLVYSIVQQPSV